MRAPEFWLRQGGTALALAPAGWAYAAGGWLRERLASPVAVGVPVICIGNAVAGGAGKTPTLLALAKILADLGPHALSRGYGGREAGPLQVDQAEHSATDVGDEPLLLARHLPSWIARDRVAGAKAAAEAGAGMVLMDDGLQNPALAKTVSLLVVDGVQGFGNGRFLPAGPLREPAGRALARADAVVLVGDGGFQPETKKPVFQAWIEPAGDAGGLHGRRIVGFAGIGRPQKFFDTLAQAGAELVATFAFADHHVFQEAELQQVADSAGDDAVMMTTEKDWVRLPDAWKKRVQALPVELRFADAVALEAFLRARLAAGTAA